MKPAVVVVGSLNMDFLVKTSHLPAAGETVLGYGFRMVPGGKGANQAVAAGKLGAASVTVRMVGRVGLDLFADHLKASLSSAGVDVSAVHASRTQPTGVALIAVDEKGQNQIVVASGANMDMPASDVEGMRRVFKGARIGLFQLETPLDTVAAALKIAREEGLRTILDPAPAQPLAPEMLRDIDILTPNEAEAFMLLGRRPERVTLEDAPLLAAEVAKLGSHMVVLKLGDNGCFFVGGGERCHVPAFAVEAVDSTAAGDTFNAALAIALAEGAPIPHALRFANAAAAISVTRLGAQASAPTRSEVDRLLDALF
ncbi:MAG: ribokinase [Bryobacteraceae bacterium]|jgi:ribokinase